MQAARHTAEALIAAYGVYTAAEFVGIQARQFVGGVDVHPIAGVSAAVWVASNPASVQLLNDALTAYPGMAGKTMFLVGLMSVLTTYLVSSPRLVAARKRTWDETLYGA